MSGWPLQNILPEQLTARYGLPVTTVARTVVEIARASPVRAGVVTADSALRLKLTARDANCALS